MLQRLTQPFLLVVLVLAACAAQAAAQTPAVTCQAVVTVSNAWVSDGTNSSYSSVNLNIVNSSPQILTVPWSLTLKSPTYGNIKQVCPSQRRLFIILRSATSNSRPIDLGL